MIIITRRRIITIIRRSSIRRIGRIRGISIITLNTLIIRSRPLRRTMVLNMLRENQKHIMSTHAKDNDNQNNNDKN